MKEKKKLIIAIVLVILLGILILAIVNSTKDNSLKVTFETRGGTEVETQKLKKGELVEIPGEPKKEGYEFIGWYYDGEKFDFSQKLDKSVKLEAKWLKVGTLKNTVTFDSAGGSRVEEQKVDSGEQAKKPTNPTRTGYTFVEWTLNGKAYDFNTSVKEDITLVAVWKQNEVVVNQPVAKPTTKPTTKPATKPVTKPIGKPEETKKVYTVHFYSDGVEVSSVQVEEGKLVAEPSLSSKENYIFMGWQYQSKLYDFTKPVTSNMRLEAIWKPILETVTVPNDTNLTNGSVIRNASNQTSVTTKKGVNQVTITRSVPLTSIDSILNDGTTAKWVALSLNIGVKPESVEAISETNSQANSTIAILDEELNQNDTTEFIIWVDVDAFEAENQKLVFKDAEKNIVGTILVVVDYQKMTSPSVTTITNSKVEISISGDTITVLELPGATSSYQLAFDFGTAYVDAVGATIAPGTGKTEVIATIDEKTTEIVFSNTAPNLENDKITYKIEYQEVVVTKVYPKNGDISIDSNMSQYVAYNADGTFTVIATISAFTFTDNGSKVSAIKDETTKEWSFVPSN